jgi:hypothetical protein
MRHYFRAYGTMCNPVTPWYWSILPTPFTRVRSTEDQEVSELFACRGFIKRSWMYSEDVPLDGYNSRTTLKQLPKLSVESSRKRTLREQAYNLRG